MPDEPKNKTGILEANYADGGRAPIGSLVGKATVTLRSRRVEAETGSELIGINIQGAGHASDKKFLQANNDGGVARYARLNLSDVASVTCRVAAKTGGTIELHRDSPTGELLGHVEVKPTGAWNVWEEIVVPMKSVEQRCDLFAVFKNPGQTNFVSLDWLQFNPRAIP